MVKTLDAMFTDPDVTTEANQGGARKKTTTGSQLPASQGARATSANKAPVGRNAKGT